LADLLNLCSESQKLFCRVARRFFGQNPLPGTPDVSRRILSAIYPASQKGFSKAFTFFFEFLKTLFSRNVPGYKGR